MWQALFGSAEIWRNQKIGGLAKRLAPVAVAVLFVWGNFSKRMPCIRKKEYWIIAEPMCAAWVLRDDTLCEIRRNDQHAALSRHRDYANKARSPIDVLFAFQFAKQLLHILRIAGSRSRVARGTNPRYSSERRHGQARIVREHDFRREPAVVQRLPRGNLCKCRRGLVEGAQLRKIGELLNFERCSRCQFAIFAQLAGVG